MPGQPTRNDDVDWDSWPVQDYLAENYREIHPSDAAVIAHHSEVYRGIAPGSAARSVEFGAGPTSIPCCSPRPRAVGSTRSRRAPPESGT